MVQVIGFDAHLDEGAHQRRKGFDIVVHAAQQNRLAHQRDALIRQTRAGCRAPPA